MKRAVTTITLLVSGLIMGFGVFVRWKPLDVAKAGLSSWGVAIAALALGLGAINLIQVQVGNVASGKDVVYSLTTLVGFGVMAVVGIATQQTGPVYSFLWQRLALPLGETVFSLLAFYLVTALYRSFRARSIETWILLGTAVVMVLGNTPLIGLVSRQISPLANWFLSYPNTAAIRAVRVSAAVGALAAAIRAFAGLDNRAIG